MPIVASDSRKHAASLPKPPLPSPASGSASRTSSTASNTKFQTAYSNMTAAYSQAVGAYQGVAKVNPNDPSIQFALAQTAEQAQDTKTAIVA